MTVGTQGVMGRDHAWLEGLQPEPWEIHGVADRSGVIVKGHLWGGKWCNPFLTNVRGEKHLNGAALCWKRGVKCR